MVTTVKNKIQNKIIIVYLLKNITLDHEKNNFFIVTLFIRGYN